MAKPRPSQYQLLYLQDAKAKRTEQNSEDKKEIEALKTRLNDLLEKNQKNQKKAALILEHWLKKRA